MLRKNNSLCTNGGRRSAIWFALLSVAWLQLSSAAHEFDHVAEQIGESCQVCLQFDRADDADLAQPVASALAPAVAPLVRLPATDVVGPASIRSFDSRAPPQL